MSELADSIDDAEPRSNQDASPLLSKEEKESLSNADDGRQRSEERSEEMLAEMESNYAAYVREDTYGTMGKGDLSVQEKAVLVLALLAIVPVKIVLLVIILIAYYVVCRICTMFRSPEEIDMEENSTSSPNTASNGEDDASGNRRSSPKIQGNYAHLSGLRRAIIVCSGRFFSRCILFICGFYWIKTSRKDLEVSEKVGSSLTERVKPSAIVSNHVSYVDILYHMSASFPSFVAKRSVARLPLVGLISKCLGCIYVQREDKPSEFKGVSGILQRRLELAAMDTEAPLMMLFPEGTTTNGKYILPFKTGAFLAGTPVQPVILKYPYRRLSPAWDTISGVRHVILLLCQFINHLEVIWLPVYTPSEEERADPKLYASNVRKLIASEGGLIQSEIGLHEKRIYHSFLSEYLKSRRLD